jgi:D-arabinose 1-dehydrogenase-like Zn-dependent alcohol dehydrogenase
VREAFVSLAYFLLVFVVATTSIMSFLVFGGVTGWIGQTLVKTLQDEGVEVHVAQSRLENRQDVERYEATHYTTHSVNATLRPMELVLMVVVVVVLRCPGSWTNTSPSSC